VKCDKCNKDGELVAQFRCGANKRVGIMEPWVFRYYLCRWHRAGENRKNKEKVLVPIEFIPDEKILELDEG
jgi:hypothetical protein